MTTNMLNLSNWTVDNITESTLDYRIEATYRLTPTACVHCGVFDRYYRHGVRPQEVMDTPIHGKRVGIIVQRGRFRCRDCGRTFLQPLPDVDERHNMTVRLVDYIERESLWRTFVSISDDTGVCEGTVRNIFRAYIDRLNTHTSIVTPTWMGLDELHIVRKPRGIVTNVQENTIVDMLPNRDKRTVTSYLSRLPDREKVELVCMDMWTPYRDAVRTCLPNAVVVVDKWHVLRMANQALDTVRKATRESLTTKERRRLMHDRFLLLKRAHELTPSEQILQTDENDFNLLRLPRVLLETWPNIISAISRYWESRLSETRALERALEQKLQEATVRRKQ